MKKILKEISNCKTCIDFLPFPPRPIIQASSASKIIIIGQAPGSIVNKTGIPWDDKSGENLRKWMGISTQDFYNTEKFGLIPMGFCFPGTGKTGDLAPRKECAPLWHNKVLDLITGDKLIVLIGKYAQDYYLDKRAERNLTETVRNYKKFLPEYFVLPHPSPRNNIWMKRNEWFKNEVLPDLKKEIIQRL
jgi:uracil-DNA glycosylase family 4